MARGKKTGGRDFPKGVCQNPGGRPSPLKEFSKVNTARIRRILKADEIREMFSRYSLMTPTELQEALQNPETVIIERIIIAGLLKAEEDSDFVRLNYVLDRTVGKVTDKVEIELPQPMIIRRRNGEEVHLIAQKTEPEVIDAVVEEPKRSDKNDE